MTRTLLLVLFFLFNFLLGCKKQNIIKHDSNLIINDKPITSKIELPIKVAPHVDDLEDIEDFYDRDGNNIKIDAIKNDNLKIVYFDFDKSNLTNDSLIILKDNANFLIKNPKTKIIIEGHTDNRGTTEYNLSLGQRRAVKVKEYYVQCGISNNRIATVSYGREKPIDLNNNEIAWSKNRRVESKIFVVNK
ncbi:MAG: peptidoglycan-associated lipoprotein Pal [Endomicrobium sp.]|jgi:peptidoglycan-associated lipoprotein|nr:peptidoglycan-associated lipoprotein Pal [Endomicrobium sp.]